MTGPATARVAEVGLAACAELRHELIREEFAAAMARREETARAAGRVGAAG